MSDEATDFWIGVDLGRSTPLPLSDEGTGSVAGVCADLLLSYQRNSVRVIGGGNGGDEGCSRGF